ncbi:hypothetical protein KC318_g1082 [Hortaea werneckii]|nr:hypothetical protein KC334_g1098 [Hortaea werneckii]KAI7025243.1 hypothetical protein KC355_g1107 [Hortaea werneckii]KAI7675251.1 hypothetical protein KC318_g1082 [Hortaea werneckii]
MNSAGPSRSRVRFDTVPVEAPLPERGAHTRPPASEDARTSAKTDLAPPQAEVSRQQGANDISDFDLDRIISLLNEAGELSHVMFRALELLNPDSSSWHIVDPSVADTSILNALPEKRYKGLKPSHSKVVLPVYHHQEAHFGIVILDLAMSRFDLFEQLQSQKLYEKIGKVARAFVKCLVASNCFQGPTKPRKEWLETRSNAWLAFAFENAKAAKNLPQIHSPGLYEDCRHGLGKEEGGEEDLRMRIVHDHKAVKIDLQSRVDRTKNSYSRSKAAGIALLEQALLPHEPKDATIPKNLMSSESALEYFNKAIDTLASAAQDEGILKETEDFLEMLKQLRGALPFFEKNLRRAQSNSQSYKFRCALRLQIANAKIEKCTELDWIRRVAWTLVEYHEQQAAEMKRTQPHYW